LILKKMEMSWRKKMEALDYEKGEKQRDHGRKSLIMKMEMSWRKKMEDLDHEKGEEQKIMEERAWPWSRRRAEGKRWKLLTMKKKKSWRSSRKKDIGYEVGEELKEKDGSSWPWKRRRVEDHWRKSRTWPWSNRRAEGKRWKFLTMKKWKSRISWKKELDHEVGEELKEKDGSAWNSLTVKMEMSWRNKKELDLETGESWRIQGRDWPWSKRRSEGTRMEDLTNWAIKRLKEREWKTLTIVLKIGWSHIDGEDWLFEL
jgi:hypothetical protein